MSIRWVTALLLVVCAVGAPSLAAEGDGSAETVEITGWIVDEICKQANANPNGEACTRKCHAGGAKLVLFEEEEGVVYLLSDQEAAEAHVGYVKVTGTLDGETLYVSAIEDLDHRLRRRGETGSAAKNR
ncbi:MAG TPA: hypothetical protein VMV46_17030 [Thermoanaerobaculia bacterium]|nr:hypothetical protein [Thermoanaerobaculia bacterium]